MRMVRFVSVVALAVTTFTTSLSFAASPAETEARRRFERGVTLFDGRDFGGALAEFRRADELAPSSVVKHDVALCFSALGRPVAARKVLDELLAMTGVPESERTRAKRMRQQMEERIGKLSVTVDVPGAKIEVDGLEVGTAPLAAPVAVAAGARLVTVQSPGYVPSRREATIASGDVTSLAFKLTPTDAKLARLQVRTTPPGVQVLVDGELAGQTPLPAPVVVVPGVHDVEARRAGYASAHSTVRLGDGASGELDLELKEAPGGARGTVDLTVSEPSPVVAVDGRPLSQARALLLPPGLHRLRIEHAGFFPDEREVDVPADGAIAVKIRLLPTAETRAAHDGAIATRRTASTIVILSGAVLAVAGGTWWVANRSSANDAEAELQKKYDESTPGGGGPCDVKAPTKGSKECIAELEAADDANSAAKLRSTLALVGAGVGVAAVVTGIVLRLTGPDPHRFERRGIAVLPLGFARGGGLGLSGSF